MWKSAKTLDIFHILIWWWIHTYVKNSLSCNEDLYTLCKIYKEIKRKNKIYIFFNLREMSTSICSCYKTIYRGLLHYYALQFLFPNHSWTDFQSSSFLVLTAEFPYFSMKSLIFSLSLFFFFSQSHTCGIWKFPGQGLNQSCSCWHMPQPQQCRI